MKNLKLQIRLGMHIVMFKVPPRGNKVNVTVNLTG